MLRCCNIIGKKVLIMSNKPNFASRLEAAQVESLQMGVAGLGRGV